MATSTKAKKRQQKVPKNLIEMYRRQEFRQLYDTERNVTYYKQNAEQALIQHQRSMQEYQKLILVVEKLKQEAEKKEGEIKERAETIFHLLQKHAAVDTVSATKEGVIVIRTKLVFTDIRTEDGSRTNRRACIGAYEFRIPHMNTSIRVRNITFPSAYDHWGIKHAQPCWGEWAPDVKRLASKGDTYGMVDMLFHFLRSQDDSGAYQRAQHWRDARDVRQLAAAPAYQSYKVGDLVIVCVQDANGKALKGCVGRVDWATSDAVSVEFKDHCNGHEGESGTGKLGHCWTMFNSCLMPITQEIYDKRNRYKVVTTPDQTLREMLDALPDGSTADDAIELALTNYKKIEIKLEDL